MEKEEQVTQIERFGFLTIRASGSYWLMRRKQPAHCGKSGGDFNSYEFTSHNGRLKRGTAALAMLDRMTKNGKWVVEIMIFDATPTVDLCFRVKK